MPEWNYQALAFFLGLANTIGLMAMVVYTFITNKQKANSQAIKVMEERHLVRVGGLDNRLIRVEESIEHLPTHKDIEKLHRRVDELAQETRKIEGTLAQINSSVSLIQHYLLGTK